MFNSLILSVPNLLLADSIIFFLRLHLWLMEVPRLGVKSELQLGPIPQPRQYRIWATSATYTTACGNAGSLTHWARPGIEPAFIQTLSWVLNLLSHHRNSWNLGFLCVCFSFLSFFFFFSRVWGMRKFTFWARDQTCTTAATQAAAVTTLDP